MGDGIGLGSVTDCRQRSFSDHRRHTQQCKPAPRQKSKQTQPKLMSSPINYPAYLGRLSLDTELAAPCKIMNLVISGVQSWPSGQSWMEELRR